MRTILFVTLIAIAAGCSGDQEAAPEPTPTPPTPEGTAEGTAAGTHEERAPPRPPGPEPMPPPSGRSIVRTVQPFTVEGTLADAEALVETARQRAAACYARTPGHQGVMALRVAIGADGTVSEATTSRDVLADEVVTDCMR